MRIRATLNRALRRTDLHRYRAMAARVGMEHHEKAPAVYITSRPAGARWLTVYTRADRKADLILKFDRDGTLEDIYMDGCAEDCGHCADA